MAKIKLCGLSRDVDVEYANAVQPDYVGFVFSQRSRRYVNYERAAELKRSLAGTIKAVGVFVDAPLEDVVRLVETGTIDVLQLHGREGEDYVVELRRRIGAPIIQAYRIDSELDVARAFQTRADFPLLDSGAGGTGRAFDWSKVADSPRPFFLAGGLGPENVVEAIQLLRPFAVDMSSGVETSGVKDIHKMKKAVELVRSI